ncbi:atherin-like [Panicum hallii]|uniref:atherin-like n=1 Tax=Panicum hallii TaxID=206008 RepID=UPI000DF4D789|nr:atherin-like [Panicum hallii]
MRRPSRTRRRSWIHSGSCATAPTRPAPATAVRAAPPRTPGPPACCLQSARAPASAPTAAPPARAPPGLACSRALRPRRPGPASLRIRAQRRAVLGPLARALDPSRTARPRLRHCQLGRAASRDARARAWLLQPRVRAPPACCSRPHVQYQLGA